MYDRSKKQLIFFDREHLLRTYLTSYSFYFWNKQMRFVLLFVIFLGFLSQTIRFFKVCCRIRWNRKTGIYFWFKFELCHFWGFRGLFSKINKCVVEFGWTYFDLNVLWLGNTYILSRPNTYIFNLYNSFRLNKLWVL